MQVLAEGQEAVRNVGTMGVALVPCCLPGHAAPARTLEVDEIEMGTYDAAIATFCV